MGEPIRILHVLGHLGRGGSELRTLELVRHVDPRRYRFHFCGLSGRPGELDDEIRAAGAQTHLLHCRRVGFAARFRRLLHEIQCDVVYAHVLYYSGTIVRLAAQAGAPVRVAFFRSLRDGRGDALLRRWYRRMMRRRIDRHATHILSVSDGVMAAVWGPHWRLDPRCAVIYDGVASEPFHGEADAEKVRREFGVPAGVPMYIHVGNFRDAKNHRRLVEIFASVLRERPAARLLLVGKGGNRKQQQVRQRIAVLKIEDRVVLCQQRSDVPRLLMAADAMILPSLWEGLPGAVLEACAAGTPVLASDLPGIREIADRLPQVQCLSLDEDDAAWARAAVALLAGPKTEQARQAARESFAGSPFTIRECAQRHGRVWESRAALRAPRRAA